MDTLIQPYTRMKTPDDMMQLHMSLDALLHTVRAVHREVCDHISLQKALTVAIEFTFKGLQPELKLETSGGVLTFSKGARFLFNIYTLKLVFLPVEKSPELPPVTSSADSLLHIYGME